MAKQQRRKTTQRHTSVQRKTSGRSVSKQRQQRKQELFSRIVLVGIAAFLVLGILFLASKILGRDKKENNTAQSLDGASDIDWTGAPEMNAELLTVNEYSRPGVPLEQINGIVVHYTANPGATAQNNRDYFEGLKDSHETKVSSHFIVGLDGEIVQCIPTAEISYASNDRNSDTLSIECCHPDETGQFNQATYDSLVKLTGWLCYRFGLSSEQVIRHYDVTGKLCPKYFVENEDAWAAFKGDVQEYIGVVESEVEAK
ncbi:MAG: peptidoglycan recognition family protein [Lachnospiraceae bacterium]|nr:peptidoglycan recognition family protein [Lachnospiraceae bacterium]MDD3616447.1 peptidoglycan recognition family protein [Lachnospiraceae bacterium]